MCGIFGRINRNKSINQDLFLKQLDTLNKRGPDAYGTYFDNNVGLGHRRLSIIDLSANGNQPMFNEDKTVSLIFNGEIYNYLEAKKLLKNSHNFISSSDSEVMLHLYEELGEKIVDHIEGMFAFCFYDQTKKLVTLARDHFGKKPLYYYLDSETFIFGSELKSILEDPEIKSKLSVDENSVNKFLFYGYVPSPHSIFNEIKKLDPSTVFQFDIEKWEVITYRNFWPIEHIKTENIAAIDAINKVDELIDRSVKKRLMSDVPLGIFLSGGVDSSLVAYYLSKHTSNLNSYTVCYKDHPEIDEAHYAQMAAEACGFKYNLVEFSSSDVLPSFTEIMDYIDEPMADAAVVPLYFISKHSKKDITVVLGGDGGDELFAGYPKYKAQKFINEYSYLSPIASVADKILPESVSFKKMLSSYALTFEERQFILGSGSFLPEELKLLLNKNFDLRKVFEDSYSYSKKFINDDLINKSMYLDCKIQLPDWYLVKSDRAAMANAQEMRSPLLDKELAEFAFSLSGDLKQKGGVSKYILKELAVRYYPKEMIYRPKRGFAVPMSKWIKKELKDIFKEYISKENKYVRRNYAEKLYNDHIEGRQDNTFKLLRIFSLNYFLEKYSLNG